jgi:hypothetical protein
MDLREILGLSFLDGVIRIASNVYSTLEAKEKEVTNHLQGHTE